MSGEDGLRSVRFTIDGMHCRRCVNTVRDALGVVDGIETAEVSMGSAEVRFLPQLVTHRGIEDVIEECGYAVQRVASRRGFFWRFVDRLIASNEKTFGTERLDCCNLSANRSQPDDGSMR